MSHHHPTEQSIVQVHSAFHPSTISINAVTVVSIQRERAESSRENHARGMGDCRDEGRLNTQPRSAPMAGRVLALELVGESRITAAGG